MQTVVSTTGQIDTVIIDGDIIKGQVLSDGVGEVRISRRKLRTWINPIGTCCRCKKGE